MNKAIKAIIFDVDGVLFKTHAADGSYLWLLTIKEDLGLSKDHLSRIFSPKWQSLIRGEMGTVEYFQHVFKDPIFKGSNITAEIFINYWLSKDNSINWDILEIVKNLKIPCYLGTNQEYHRTSHIIKSIGKNFAGYFASYQIGYIKPEEKFFKHIEDSLHAKPTELILVDDTIENIESAKKRGWNTFHYQYNPKYLKQYLLKQECI